MGGGDFSAAINTTSRRVAKGETASYTVTFTSIAGFHGTVVPSYLKGLRIPGATIWWTEPSVNVPSKSSAIATFLIRTSTKTPAGTYSNSVLRRTNASATHALSSTLTR